MESSRELGVPPPLSTPPPCRERRVERENGKIEKFAG